jgi:hypothetical protein
VTGHTRWGGAKMSISPAGHELDRKIGSGQGIGGGQGLRLDCSPGPLLGICMPGGGQLAWDRCPMGKWVVCAFHFPQEGGPVALRGNQKRLFMWNLTLLVMWRLHR